MMRFYTNVARRGNNLLVRERSDTGLSRYKVPFKPILYVKTNEETGYRSLIENEPVKPIEFESMSDAKEFLEKYASVSGFPVFGMTDYIRQYLGREKYEWEYKQLSIWSIDIETTVPEDENGDTEFPEPIDAKGEVLLITLTNLHTGRSFTFGSKPYSGKDTRYMDCGDEKTLLRRFLEFWQQIDVDIITGWNIEQFDIPYMVTRITDVLGEDFAKQLSPWGIVRCTNKEFNGRIEYNTELTGISILDYMVLYKKYILTKQESYSLANISEVELGHSKLDHSEYKTWREFHTKGWQEKFVPYNVVDALLIKQLDDKLNLIRIVVTVAYKAGINFEDVSSPVKTWDSIIHNALLSENVVIPQPSRARLQPLDGAYVKEPVPGRYRNVSSIDATSLYPSEIITNNISPETYVGNVGTTIEDYLNDATNAIFGDDEYVVTPAGARYSKKIRGILPRLMIQYMADRRATKNEMLRLEQLYEQTKEDSLPNQIAALDAHQNAIKVLMNSLYGATANEHFRFFKHDHAASITLSGQYMLRTIENRLDVLLDEKFGLVGGKYVLYIDTDSVYLNLDSVINKFKIPREKARAALERMTKEIVSPLVNKLCQECCDKMGSYENKISFKLEVSAPDGAIFVGKKKYALKVESSEGVVFEKPKFKVKGLEMVRSSTPKFIRDHLKDSLPLIFDGTEKQVQEFIEKTRQEFYDLPYEKVAFPRSANNLVEYSDTNSIYRKATPIAVRGALLYNHHLKRLGLTGKYRLITEGMKVRFAYLKTPNVLRENIIAFPVDGEIPVEFGIIDKIDYETQYQKTMIDAMQIILTAIGWDAIETSSLDDFFG